MQTYNPTLSVGEIQYFPGGHSFHLIEASFGVNVEYLKADLTNINQTAVAVESGYHVRYKEGFDLVKITNGNTAQTIKFGVARGGEGGYNITSSNITGGALDLVTRILNRDALLNNHYLHGCDAVASIGEYSATGLENPVGSGVVIVLESMRAITDTALNIGIYKNISFTGGYDRPNSYSNKNVGTPIGVVPEGVCWGVNGASAAFGGLSYTSGSVPIGAYSHEELIKKDAIIINEGESVALATKIVNVPIITLFEWEEY